MVAEIFEVKGKKSKFERDHTPLTPATFKKKKKKKKKKKIAF